MSKAENIHFGPFHVDVPNACVWRGNQRLSLSVKAFAILCYLLEHCDRLVTKEELLHTLWPETIVGDAVLKVHVGEIRRVLGDKSNDPQYVATVHRRGYRFIGEVVSSQQSVVSSREQSGVPRPASEVTNAYSALRTPHSALNLVGREGELQLLHSLFAQAQTGQRQFLFIAGEAGIGKTTLVDAFLAQVGAAVDTCIIAGQCVEQYSPGEAYRPLLEAIGRLCRDPQQPTLLPLLSRYAPTWIMQIPSLLTAEDVLRMRREVLGATAERMLREMAEAVEALAAERTCVLVLEDLHWCDFATLDLLASLARRRMSARLLVIATYRPVDVILSGHPLKVVRQELQIHGQSQELALELLSEDEVAEYLSRRLGMAEPDQLSALAHMIHQRTDGNPLFLVNVMSEVIRQGFVAERQGRWELQAEIETIGHTVPENVRHMIDRQIERLSETEQRILEIASVVGMEFSPAVVAAAFNGDEQDIARCCETLARQGQFLRATVLTEWPDGTMTEQYQFLHALHQSVLSQRIALGRRVHLCRRIGERLERGYGERASELAPELAAYFEQGHDYQRAVTYLLRAAETAVHRYANREAAEYLTRALQLIEHLPESEQPPWRLQTLERRGLAYRSMANMEAAARDFAVLAEHHRQQKNNERSVSTYLHLATVLSWVDRDRCLAAVQQAIASSQHLTNDDLRAYTHGEAAYWHLLWSGWRPEDERASAHAVAVARRINDGPSLGVHVGRYSYFLAVQSSYQAADAAAAEGIELTQESGNIHHFLLCHFFRAWSLFHLGQWGEMLRVIYAGREIAEKNGHHLWAILLRLQLAWLFAQTGDFTRARELCAQEVTYARELHFAYGRLLGSTLLGSAHLGLNELSQAERCFYEIEDWLGHERVLMDWVVRMPLHYSIGQYWLTKGDCSHAHDEAERLCAWACQSGERTYLALGHQLSAACALAEHYYDRAQNAIEQACAVLDGVEAPLAAWRVYATAVDVQQQRNRPHQAQQYRQRGAAVISRLADSLPDDAGALRHALLSQPSVQQLLQQHVRAKAAS